MIGADDYLTKPFGIDELLAHHWLSRDVTIDRVVVTNSAGERSVFHGVSSGTTISIE